MTRPPEIGDEVILRDQTGGAFRGEVDALRGGFVTVRLHENRHTPFTQREKMLVSWADGPGLTFLPVRLVDNPCPDLWVAEIVGEPWQEQRRQFLRTALAGTVALSPAQNADAAGTTNAAGAAGAAYESGATDATVAADELAGGSLVDLSEAGLRCAVSSRRPYLTRPTTPVTVRITVDELSFALTGKVLYGRPMARHDGMLEVVVVFDRPVAHTEALRELTRRSGAG